MQNYNWDIKTQFVFPEELGIVEDVVSVDIKPRWQLIETEDSLRLVGIYHITSTVRFDPKELPEYSEGTMIEHLELMGDAGYFEYALPLEVNLPKERVPDGSIPEISVQDIRSNVFEGASCTFSWDVLCTVSEPVVESYEQAVEQVVEQVVEQEEDVLKFESYEEPTDLHLEIPSASAFVELIQESDNPSELERVPANEEAVSFDENTSYEESYSNYSEPESVIQSTNTKNPDVEELLSHEDEVEVVNQLELVQENLQVDELAQSENLISVDEPIDRAFEDNDFFSDLGESFSILDLKSNKVSPE